MCNLCNPETAKAERESLKIKAIQLETVAKHLRGLADGHIKPHTTQASNIGSLARSIVRYLVEEYV